MDLRSFTDHIWAYLQVCSRSRIFCRFGGCFSASRQFFHLSSYQPLNQFWKRQGRQSRTFVAYLCHNMPVWCPSTPFVKGDSLRQATRDLDDSQPQFAEVVSFENKGFPPGFSVSDVCDFLQPFYKAGTSTQSTVWGGRGS